MPPVQVYPPTMAQIYGPRMQTRMREWSQKYAWRGTSLDMRTYVAALAKIAAGQVTVAGNSGSNPKN